MPNDIEIIQKRALLTLPDGQATEATVLRFQAVAKPTPAVSQTLAQHGLPEFWGGMTAEQVASRLNQTIGRIEHQGPVVLDFQGMPPNPAVVQQLLDSTPRIGLVRFFEQAHNPWFNETQGMAKYPWLVAGDGHLANSIPVLFMVTQAATMRNLHQESVPDNLRLYINKQESLAALRDVQAGVVRAENIEFGNAIKGEQKQQALEQWQEKRQDAQKSSAVRPSTRMG